MSDSNATPTTAMTGHQPSDLADLIAKTALETPGVVRLEPTLRNVLFQQVDGVQLQQAAGSIDVTVELTIDSAHTALPTAELVRSRVIDLIRLHQLMPVEVNVSVLAIDHDAVRTISRVTPGR